MKARFAIGVLGMLNVAGRPDDAAKAEKGGCLGDIMRFANKLTPLYRRGTERVAPCAREAVVYVRKRLAVWLDL